MKEKYFTKSSALLFLIFLMLIFPTSTSGNLMEGPKFIIYGASALIALFFPFFNKKRTFVASICLILLLFFTLQSNGAINGLRQLIPLLSLYLILILEYRKIDFNDTVLNAGLTSFSIIILLLGYGVIFENKTIISFLIRFYAFGYDQLAINMYSQGKPVLFFISHAIAAIAYTIIFFIVVLWGKHTSKKYFYLLAALILPIIISLKSNTSYLSLFIIALYLFFISNKIYKAIYLLLLILIINHFWVDLISLDLSIDFFLGNSNNGFLSRYDTESGVYASSFKTILESPFVGTGLLFTEGQYRADSGVINELLRGGVFFFILMKYFMYLALFTCSNNRRLSIAVVFFLTVLEIAYAFSLSLRGPMLLMMSFIYLNHIYSNKPQ